MKPSLICIGASTGGIEALEEILAHLPIDCVPVCVVQHLLAGFSGQVARRLNRKCQAEVLEGTRETPLRTGTVVLAQSNETHLVVHGEAELRTAKVAAPPQTGHRPSIDILFESAATLNASVAAVLLTGMGSDGAKGSLAVRMSGGCTIAQDETTSVVYGMPRAAVEMDAVQHILPLSAIGPFLLAWSKSQQVRIA